MLRTTTPSSSRPSGDDLSAARTGTELSHVGSYSFEPTTLRGNVEQFTGVAQVPIGIAGPLLIDGEHARGQFYVPLATTEGTLVASFNRGMRLLTENGGVRATVVDDAMQRAPAFVLDDARQARAFGQWVDDHIDDIRKVAESTTGFGSLRDVRQYSIGPLRYLRFNYTCGDAAGQNMTGRPPSRPARGSRSTTPATSATCCRETSTRTRSTRGSTCSRPAANALSRRP